MTIMMSDWESKVNTTEFNRPFFKEHVVVE